MTKLNEVMMANAVRAIQNKEEDSQMTDELMLEDAAKQAEGIAKIASETKADPIFTHDQELRRVISALDGDDMKVAMNVIVTKDPFAVIDALRRHIDALTSDLNEIRDVFAQRDRANHYICGGDIRGLCNKDGGND